MKALTVMLSIAAVSTAMFGAVDIEWTQQYGSGWDEEAQSVATDNNGNIVIVGYTAGEIDGHVNAGERDIFVSKFSPDGVRQWTQQYGTELWEVATGVATDSSGNIYVTGYTAGALDDNTKAGDEYDEDIFVSKFAPNGTKEWTFQYGSTLSDYAFGIAIGSNEDLYITGTTWGDLDENTNAGGGWSDVFVSRFTTSGTKEWTRQYGTSENETGYSVATDSNGLVYVTGETGGDLDENTNAGTYGDDIFVSKFTTDGIKEWTRQYGTSEDDYGSSVAIDSDDNIYITGTTRGDLDGNTNAVGSDPYSLDDIFLSKFTSDGVKQWTVQYGTSADDRGNSVAINKYDDVFIGGYTLGILDDNAFSQDGREIFLSKFETNGQRLWTQQYGLGAPYGDYPYAVATGDGSTVYVTGTTGGDGGNGDGEGGDGIPIIEDETGCCLFLTKFGKKASADFDADRKSDILWRNADTGLNYLYIMDGFTEVAVEINTVENLNWQITGIGDFNGDGHNDILWRNFSSDVLDPYQGANYIYFMDSSDIIAEGIVNFVKDQNWQVAGVNDFNGDGKADILWRNSVTGDNYLYIMYGNWIMSEGLVNTVADQNWQIAGMADFNGDNKADILWRNSVTGDNYLYTMDGTVIASDGPIRAVVDLSWQITGVADFNGDDKADILWRNNNTGMTYLYMMNGTTITSEGIVTNGSGMDWQIKGTGDYDGDGKADILWRNISTGAQYSGMNYLFLMNGTAIKSEDVINQVKDMNWEIIQ